MPDRKLSQHILTKIVVTLVVAVAFVCVGNNKVSAQENSGVFAKHELHIAMQSNLTADISYIIELTNNNESPLNTFTLQLPFIDVFNAKMQINGVEGKISTTPIVGGTTFTSEFTSEALLERQTKKITFQFKTGPVAVKQFGLIQLYLDKVEADHIITNYLLTIDYPADFPKLIYTSTGNLTSKPNQVQLSSLNGMLVQWADKVDAQIQEELPLDFTAGRDNLLFNLLRDMRGQTVSYLKLENLELAAEDKVGNLWGLGKLANASNPISYSLNWQNTPEQYVDTSQYVQPDYRSDDLELPEQLQKFNFGKTKLEALHGIYDYMLHAFSASSGEAATRVNVSQTYQQVKQGNRVLNDLQYSYLTVGYCQALKVSCRVVYGYLASPNFSKINTNNAHTWVEAVAEDNKLIILDPYLEVLTGGYNYFGATNLGRIVYGAWDPALREDTVLGLMQNKPRSRPSLNPVSTTSKVNDVFSMTLNFPPRVKGGEFYFGTITFSNNSNQFVFVDKLEFNGKDMTDQLLEVTPQLRRVMLPFTESRLDIDYQRNTNFLADSIDTLTVNLVPKSDLIPPMSSIAKVTFVPNANALTAILIIVMIIAFSMLAVVVKIVADEIRVQARLKKKYHHKQKPESVVHVYTPVEDAERVVHKVSDIA